MAYATGKRSKAISDRSGMEFPYKEMVREWNGSLVHISEFEPKHPQLDPPYHKADAIALVNPRPDVDPGRNAIVDLSPDAWPGQFTVVSFTVTVGGVQTQLPSQQPSITPSEMNKTRQMRASVGELTVSIT